ncbi:ThiF family adenylyltransferase [Chitinophaga sp. S165]|uniref:ThiF family adenylyltransferase n=1 Tax=Chitinophaga sp. S165 TaxID=2135462 RepID=UPI001E294BBA|nr:ThiF family adenylyltransferase [Chitinophaga sp. S165]
MKLQDSGYEIEVCGGYLVAHHIPYVNAKREVAYGKLVCPLTQNAGKTLRPSDHVMYFAGGQPCNTDGQIIKGIYHSEQPQVFTDTIAVDRSFSNKPPDGYADYYEKVHTYASILSAQAKALDKAATPLTFRRTQTGESESVFCYPDTNSVRAHIVEINKKLAGQKVAIIGLGGTGSYILDLIAKTPVAEIHLFDADVFLQHNAFRAPGAPSLDELAEVHFKVDYFKRQYETMHRNIIAHSVRITSENISELAEFDFTFISIDSNSSRAVISAFLLGQGKPFIDVGMGVEIVGDSLIGTTRMTVGTAAKSDHLKSRVALIDAEDDLYASNIQIADLNMLNATMAVIKWKKMFGFYQDLMMEHNATYTINTSQYDTSDFNP